MTLKELREARSWLGKLHETHCFDPVKARAAKSAINAVEKVVVAVGSVCDANGRPGDPVPAESANCVRELRGLLKTGPSMRVDGRRKRTVHSSVKAAGTSEASGYDKKVEVDPASQMTCGKPPYVAEIVPHRGGKAVWTADRSYLSEHAAENAIIKAAANLMHRVTGYGRHWITESGEHIIDYGSDCYYGRITSKRQDNDV